VVLVAAGALVSKAIAAGRQLAAQGIHATVVNHPFINRVDVASIGPAVQAAGGRLVTIEDHQIIGGLGAQVSHALSQAGVAHRAVSLGLRGEFGQSAYLADQLYEKHGLTATAMVEAARQLIGSR
jgi:transketolase